MVLLHFLGLYLIGLFGQVRDLDLSYLSMFDVDVFSVRSLLNFIEYCILVNLLGLNKIQGNGLFIFAMESILLIELHTSNHLIALVYAMRIK